MLPRYGEASLADLLPSVLAHLGVEGYADVLGLDGLPPRVIVLVADGLGFGQLTASATLAPTLAPLADAPLDAGCPPTTVTSLASIGTGRPPGGHGLFGYAVALRDHDQPFNQLGWRIGMRAGGFDARETVVPEAWQPRRTVLEHASESGVNTTVVVHPAFLDSGLTRAALRGGRRTAARSLDGTLEAAVAAATRHDAPTLVYAHFPGVDWAGHNEGPGSDDWRDAVTALDRTVARIRASAPRDLALLVTADHGMVEVPDSQVVELEDRPDLLEGVRVVAGEPRLRHLALAPDVDPTTVVDRWRGALGDRVVPATRDEAIDAGWFGPEVDPRVRDRVGDVVVQVLVGSVVHARVDPMRGRQRGQHGALTREEVHVPLLRVSG